jgi:hypothetical protein
VALDCLHSRRIALPVTQRYFGTYFFCFNLLIDERQFQGVALPFKVRRSRKTSSTNAASDGRPARSCAGLFSPLRNPLVTQVITRWSASYSECLKANLLSD